MRATVLALVCAGLLAACAQGAEWTDLGAKYEEQGLRLGYNGIEVDRVNGHVYLLGRGGVWRTTDDGATWEDIAGEAIIGKQWYAHALRLDPNGGGRLAVFKKDPPKDPLQSGMTLDDGKTWTPIDRVLIEGDKLRSYGWSWGVVDWTQDEPTFMVAKMHHSDRMWKSTDAGKSWEELPTNTDYMGVWDAETLVCARPDPRQNRDDDPPEIYRSTDAGVTWELVTNEFKVTQWIPIRVGERMFWLVEDGLIVTDDGGATWQHTGGKLEGAYFGPYFGKAADDIIVGTLDAIYRTADAGKSWTRIAENIATDLVEERARQRAERDGKELAEGEKPPYRFHWFIGQADFGWDPVNEKLYLAYKGLYELNLSE